MARTWSVPQWGNFAASAAWGLRPDGSLRRLANAGIRDTQRGPLLLVSAILTALGIAVLNVDSQSLATLLLVAGAGLATTVILFSEHNGIGSSSDVLSKHDAATRFRAPAKFSELISPSETSRAIDRATWAKLTAHMSHELRTPLNAVLGFSELMSNEVFGPLGSSYYGEYARDIHASGRMLLKSAEDALAITALLTSPERKGSLRPCGLKAILDGARTFTQPDLNSRSITVEANVASDVEVVCDPQAARQMLINLLAEASRTACDGAKLEIGARSEGDAVMLSIDVSNAGANSNEDDGFPLVLARTLGELSGARLATEETPAGGRRWTVRFLAVTQNELFAKRA